MATISIDSKKIGAISRIGEIYENLFAA